MRFTLLISISLFFYSFSTGQSIYEDVLQIDRALTVLKHAEASDLDPEERQKAAVQLLSVLLQYHDPLEEDFGRITPDLVLNEFYVRNDFISQLLKDTLFAKIDLPHGAIYDSLSQLRSGKRQRILMDMAQSDQLVPRTDWSDPNLLNRYSKPILSTSQAMELSASGSNQNVRNNAVISQAAIIEGLAQFILERAKDELVLNFLDRLIKKETPEFERLFPTVVAEFSDKNLSFSSVSFLERLRYAFFEDLQKLSVNFPLLLLQDDYFKTLQTDPVAYNLLVIYTMVSLSQFDLTIEEIIPRMHAQLFRIVDERNREVNLHLADSAFQTAEYGRFTALADSVVLQMDAIAKELVDLQTAIDQQRMKIAYFNPASLPESADFLEDQHNYRNVIGKQQDSIFNLLNIANLLKGKVDTALISEFYYRLEHYDQIFDQQKKPDQLRALGIDLSRSLTMGNVDQTLEGWTRGLLDYGTAVEDIFTIDSLIREEAFFDPPDNWTKSDSAYQAQLDSLTEVIQKKQFKESLERKRTQLQNTILNDMAFWQQYAGSEGRSFQFKVLSNTIDQRVFDNIRGQTQLDYFDSDLSLIQIDSIITEEKVALIREVEKRLEHLDQELFDQFPQVEKNSPARQYLGQKGGMGNKQTLLLEVQKLENKLSRLELVLDSLDHKYVPQSAAARDNALPILQITGILPQLMYCLRTQDTISGSNWLSVAQLDSLLDGGHKEALFLGLLQQRLSSLKHIGPFSTDGLSNLVRLTIKDLRLLSDPEEGTAPDSLAFYRKTSFVVNTMNRLLTMPLITDPENPRNYTSLIEHPLKELEQIPEISVQALDFIYYSNIKNHGRAVSSLIRLLTSLEDCVNILQVKDTPIGEKGKSVILFLQEHGDFIAGLVDARDESEVKILLEEMADPPGGSRKKRNQSLTIGLNAYLGGSAGIDQLSDFPDGSGPRSSWFLAPTMPIGIAVSRLLGRQSFSFFVSLLDVGSLLYVSPDSNEIGEPDLTFKNMLKPGVQVHWNIQNSPFYLGLGYQFGPQFQRIDEEQISLRSERVFLSFGIDVPIKTYVLKR